MGDESSGPALPGLGGVMAPALTTERDRLKAEAYAEIAEVMGRRGAQLDRLDFECGPQLARWAARFQAQAAQLDPKIPRLSVVA